MSENKEPIMLEFSSKSVEKNPIYEIKTYSDFEHREVISFEYQPVANRKAPEKTLFFRGRGFVQFGPNVPPQAIIFEFEGVKTLEECFDKFDDFFKVTIDAFHKKQMEQSKIVTAKGMPQIPSFKR
jgi:hypothetical protein